MADPALHALSSGPHTSQICGRIGLAQLGSGSPFGQLVVFPDVQG